MWFISNFLCYFTTTAFIVCCATLILLLKKLINFSSKVQKKNNLNSIETLEITTREQCYHACWLLRSHCKDLNALGFDCEWVSADGKQRPVALLQLATVHGLCCLFRLNLLCEIPNELENILRSSVIKLGISPLNDAKLLKQDYNTQVYNTLDLRYLYPAGGGLASLAASEISVKLNKSWWLQCSDWESRELTDSQKDYAAKDAFVAVEIFKKWLLTKNNLFHLYGKNLLHYNHLLNEELKSELSGYLDMHFKTKGCSETSEKSNKKKITESISYQNYKKEKSGFVVRKSPLYQNCFMHAPDGELLCSCDKRKAQWYLDRGLAEVLLREPYSIKLLFEPAARAGDNNGGRFYQQLKQNLCVVCGEQQSYLKHNVVPKEYRKHFPNIMKDHQSHDIVLMCLRCHHLAAQHNEYLRQKLGILCNAPIKASKVTQVRTIQKVKSMAKALLYAGDVIPLEKKIQIQDEVKKYFKVKTLNLDLLNKAANLESKYINENYESHGERVVNYFFQEGGGLKELEILWRKHFLDTMKPQYLPALWSVTHNHSRLDEKNNENQILSHSIKK